MVRFIPKIEVAVDMDFYLFDGATKHEISRYFDTLPVDIAMQIGFSKITI